MRICKRISLALLAALTCATPTMAQDDRFSFNAAVGPSFANLGTTFSSTGGLDVRSTTAHQSLVSCDFATNLGGGVFYRFNDHVGVGADSRTFFVHRDDDTPKVNRLTAGLRFSIK